MFNIKGIAITGVSVALLANVLANGYNLEKPKNIQPFSSQTVQKNLGYETPLDADNPIDYFAFKNYKVFTNDLGERILSTEKHLEGWKLLGDYIPNENDQVMYVAIYVSESRGYRMNSIPIKDIKNVILENEEDYIGVYEYEDMIRYSFLSGYSITGEITCDVSKLKVSDKSMTLELIKD